MAQQRQPKASAQERDQANKDASRLLDELLNKAGTHHSRFIEENLIKREHKIETVLPVSLKGQARRMINRAIMTFNRRPELADCPPEEFLRCVLEAAEIGLAIDGKLCYVIKYKSVWQVVPDYKGLVAVAKRSGQVKDVYAECVTKQDTFRAYRDANGEHLFHERTFGSRNDVVCAYAVVVRTDDSTHHEIMDITELNAIQARAPSKSGPWSTDINEMRKKTVIRRILKLYSDDPAMARAIELDDKLYDELGAAGAAVSMDQQSLRAQSATMTKADELRSRLLTQQATTTATFEPTREKEKVPVEDDDPFRNPGPENRSARGATIEAEGSVAETPESGQTPPPPPVNEEPWYESWRAKIDSAADVDTIDAIEGKLYLVAQPTDQGRKELAATFTILLLKRLNLTKPISGVQPYVARMTMKLAQLLDTEQVQMIGSRAEAIVAAGEKDNPKPKAAKTTQKGLPGTEAQAY